MILSNLLDTLNIALKIYDRHLSTKYQEKYIDLYKSIQKEESKPLSKENAKPSELRDQNKLDHLYFDLKLFLETFNKTEGKK